MSVEAVSGEPHTFLRTAAGFSPADLAQLDRGEPIARVLDTDRREVAVVGAVRIRASQARLFERFRNIANLQSSDVVLQIGRFGTRPSADDLRDLQFEDYDLETIRKCRPGDCGVRLSGANMDRFARDVNWNAPGWREQAASLWRQLLAADAAAYMANGTLGEYRNKGEPLDVADEFRLVFESAKYFETIAPDFFSYLKRFPSVRLDGTENILYWSKDDINRPVTRVTHLVLYPALAGSRRPGLIATKQIYAAHYFDAGLGTHLCVRRWGVGVLHAVGESRPDSFAHQPHARHRADHRPAAQPRRDGRDFGVDERSVGGWQVAAPRDCDSHWSVGR